jgi:hypothetical protein
MTKRKKKRKSGFRRGFKETTVPGDSGYVKPRKDGGRYHKRSKNGPIHIDKVDPAKHATRHLMVDVFKVSTPPKKRRKRRR